jgi:hypothetical protein
MSASEMWCASVPSYMDKEAREPPLHISNKSPFGKRLRARSSHDEMVENPYVDQGQRLTKVLREQFVRATRLGESRRVIVGECDVRSH